MTQGKERYEKVKNAYQSSISTFQNLCFIWLLYFLAICALIVADIILWSMDENMLFVSILLWVTDSPYEPESYYLVFGAFPICFVAFIPYNMGRSLNQGTTVQLCD